MARNSKAQTLAAGSAVTQRGIVPNNNTNTSSSSGRKAGNKKQNDPRMQYSGWRVPPGWQVPRIAVDAVDAKQLWTQYVAKRMPVVLVGDLKWGEGLVGAHWSNDYLRRRAGDMDIEVEERSDAAGAFGRGNKVHMKFGQLLDLLDGADDKHYLGSTEPPPHPQGGPGLFSPPLGAFTNELPWRPELLAPLVTQQINLWMGNAPAGASTGLHHDFHDNLYVLLRGRKRFTLFSPADTLRMCTFGTPKVIYPNGRILHEGAPEVRADGASLIALAEEARDVATLQLQQAVAALNAAKERGSKAEVADLTAQVAEAENALDAAMEAALEHADAGMDDYDDEMGAFGDGMDDMDAGEDVDGDADSDDDHDDDEGDDEDDEDGFDKSDSDDAKADHPALSEPPSFSRVSTALLHSGKRFPPEFNDMNDASRVEVVLGPRDMLFLPAGWFHEVTSFGAGSQGHVALNFWFHPPDNCDAPDSFEHPYVDPYWERDWSRRFAAAAATSSAAAAATAIALAEDPLPSASDAYGVIVDPAPFSVHSVLSSPDQLTTPTVHLLAVLRHAVHQGASVASAADALSRALGAPVSAPTVQRTLTALGYAQKADRLVLAPQQRKALSDYLQASDSKLPHAYIGLSFVHADKHATANDHTLLNLSSPLGFAGDMPDGVVLSSALVYLPVTRAGDGRRIELYIPQVCVEAVNVSSAPGSTPAAASKRKRGEQTPKSQSCPISEAVAVRILKAFAGPAWQQRITQLCKYLSNLAGPCVVVHPSMDELNAFFQTVATALSPAALKTLLTEWHATSLEAALITNDAVATIVQHAGHTAAVVPHGFPELLPFQPFLHSFSKHASAFESPAVTKALFQHLRDSVSVDFLPAFARMHAWEVWYREQ